MQRIPSFLAFALMALLAGPAFAQSPAKGPTAKRATPTAEAPARVHLNARGKLLRQKLGVEDAQAARLDQIIEQHETQYHAAQADVHAQEQALEGLLHADSPDLAAYRQTLTKLRSAQHQAQSVRDRELDTLMRELNPKQQAKLMQVIGKVWKKSRASETDASSTAATASASQPKAGKKAARPAERNPELEEN